MTKKEKENLLINAWRLARHFERNEKKNLRIGIFSYSNTYSILYREKN